MPIPPLVVPTIPPGLDKQMPMALEAFNAFFHSKAVCDVYNSIAVS